MYILKLIGLHRLFVNQHLLNDDRSTKKILETIKKSYYWMPLSSSKEDGQLNIAGLEFQIFASVSLAWYYRYSEKSANYKKL